MNRAWIVAVFVALLALLAVGLRLDPHEVPSPLIGKPAPAFDLPLVAAPATRFSEKDMLGQVWVLNVWASWCTPCLAEHPVVSELARSGAAPVIGLNYKDAREDALAWLRRNGDPYRLVAADADGRVGVDYGVYGVPETYVIDRHGVIRYKQIGPLTPELVRGRVAPLLEELKREG